MQLVWLRCFNSMHGHEEMQSQLAMGFSICHFPSPNWVAHLERQTPTHCNRDPLNCLYAHPRFPERRVVLHWESILVTLVPSPSFPPSLVHRMTFLADFIVRL